MTQMSLPFVKSEAIEVYQIVNYDFSQSVARGGCLLAQKTGFSTMVWEKYLPCYPDA